MVPFWVYENTDDNDNKEISTILVNVGAQETFIWTQELLYHCPKKKKEKEKVASILLTKPDFPWSAARLD